MFAINMWLYLEQVNNHWIMKQSSCILYGQYPLKTMENKIKVMEDKLLVTKSMKHFPIDPNVGTFLEKLV